MKEQKKKKRRENGLKENEEKKVRKKGDETLCSSFVDRGLLESPSENLSICNWHYRDFAATIECNTGMKQPNMYMQQQFKVSKKYRYRLWIIIHLPIFQSN